MRKKIALLFGMFVTVLSVWAQENLVINPSFELDSCPTDIWGGGLIYLVNGWDTLRGGGGGSPDAYSECFPENYDISVPANNLFGRSFQYAHLGIGYVGIGVTAYSNGLNHKEYIQGSLIHKLIQGRKYCAEMFVSLMNASEYSCMPLGIYLDDGSVQALGYQIPFPLIVPQVVNIEKQLDDTLDWVKIGGSFIANGTEEYITIGNFFPDSISGVVHSYPSTAIPSNTFKGAYYYIDDVSVVEIPDVYAGNDTTIHAGDSVFLGRQAGVENGVYAWHANGVLIDSTAGLWVQPDSTTTYTLQQSICSNVSYDTVTVTVTVDFGSGISPLANEARIKLYPNPAVSHIRFSEYTNVGLYSITGQFMTEKENVNALDISTFSPGVYVTVFTDKKGAVIQRSRVVKR